MTYEELMIRKYGIKRLNRDERVHIRALLNSMPGPTPWGAKNYGDLKTPRDTYHWRQQESWVLLHRGSDDACVMIIGMYARPIPATDGFIAFWTDVNGGIELTCHELDKLQSLTKEDEPAEYRPVNAKGSEPWRKLLPGTLHEGSHVMSGAKELSSNEEVLMVCGRSVGLSDADPAVAIYSWRPRDRTLAVTNLDWFTGRDFDLGYEWITDVIRDPESGHIFGRGFRIPQFELEDDDKTVRRWLYAYSPKLVPTIA